LLSWEIAKLWSIPMAFVLYSALRWGNEAGMVGSFQLGAMVGLHFVVYFYAYTVLKRGFDKVTAHQAGMGAKSAGTADVK
jgi:hypothetical protein